MDVKRFRNVIIFIVIYLKILCKNCWVKKLSCFGYFMLGVWILFLFCNKWIFLKISYFLGVVFNKFSLNKSIWVLIVFLVFSYFFCSLDIFIWVKINEDVGIYFVIYYILKLKFKIKGIF